MIDVKHWYTVTSYLPGDRRERMTVALRETRVVLVTIFGRAMARLCTSTAWLFRRQSLLPVVVSYSAMAVCWLLTSLR